jgi:hypothetical protein
MDQIRSWSFQNPLMWTSQHSLMSPHFYTSMSLNLDAPLRLYEFCPLTRLYYEDHLIKMSPKRRFYNRLDTILTRKQTEVAYTLYTITLPPLYYLLNAYTNIIELNEITILTIIFMFSNSRHNTPPKRAQKMRDSISKHATALLRREYRHSYTNTGDTR